MSQIEPNRENIENAIQKIETVDIETISEPELENIIIELISGYRSTIPRYTQAIKLYRAVRGKRPVLLSDISYPPKEFVTAYGRGNKIGQPMFYCSNSGNTLFFELDCKKGDRIAISTWKNNTSLVLNHLGYTTKTTTLLSSARNLDQIYSFVKDTNNHSSLNTMMHEYLGLLFSSPNLSANDQLNFKLTSLLANKMVDVIGVNGLMYPSVRMTGNSDNLMLKPEYVDRHLEFVNVQYMEISDVRDNSYHSRVIDAAISVDDNNRIKWLGRPLQIETQPGDLIILYRESGEYVARNKHGSLVDFT